MDEGVGPHIGFQLGPGDQLAGALDQQGEDVERPAADPDGLAGAQQGLAVRQEAEIAELVRPLGRTSPRFGAFAPCLAADARVMRATQLFPPSMPPGPAARALTPRARRGDFVWNADQAQPLPEPVPLKGLPRPVEKRIGTTSTDGEGRPGQRPACTQLP